MKLLAGGCLGLLLAALLVILLVLDVLAHALRIFLALG